MTEQLLSVVDVCAKLRINRTSLHGLRKAGKFPEPIRIGRSVRWRQCDIDAYVQRLAAAAVAGTPARAGEDARSGAPAPSGDVPPAGA